MNPRQRHRPLSEPERGTLKALFHHSVDLSRVRITRGSVLALASATVTGNTINLQARHFEGDTMQLNALGQQLLVHEVGHVWQYQNGGLAYIVSSLFAQAVATLVHGSRNAAYDWRAGVLAGRPWARWNAEQQAECISDCFEAQRRCRGAHAAPQDHQTVALAQPYLALVRQRFGAPGAPRAKATP